MRKGLIVALCGLCCLCMAGCPVSGLGNLFGLNTTTIRLVNTGDFDVVVELYIHDQQEILESLLPTLGEQIVVTVSAGQSTTISRDCDDIQIVMVDDADLNIIGGIGPSQNTRAYRDGDDFNCGDTLTFTFSHPTLPTELNIDFSKN